MVATVTMVLRRGKGGDMIPMIALGSVVAAAIAVPSPGNDGARPPGAGTVRPMPLP